MANATESNQVRPKFKKPHENSTDGGSGGDAVANSPARNGAVHRHPPRRDTSYDGESQSTADGAVSCRFIRASLRCPLSWISDLSIHFLCACVCVRVCASSFTSHPLSPLPSADYAISDGATPPHKEGVGLRSQSSITLPSSLSSFLPFFTHPNTRRLGPLLLPLTGWCLSASGVSSSPLPCSNGQHPHIAVFSGLFYSITWNLTLTLVASLSSPKNWLGVSSRYC